MTAYNCIEACFLPLFEELKSGKIYSPLYTANDYITIIEKNCWNKSSDSYLLSEFNKIKNFKIKNPNIEINNDNDFICGFIYGICHLDNNFEKFDKLLIFFLNANK